ncbi:MAG: hypothetical protein KJ723_04285 [candidate division Zixibacteria bacterium]|nr:hypothetical protein [candidate division Zixibacteria bacterium]
MLLTLTILVGSLVSAAAAQPCAGPVTHFTFNSDTEDYYALILDSACLCCDLDTCDEIGVFDGDLCVGASVFMGEWPLDLMAWEDDPMTDSVDGYTDGSQIVFRIWNYSTEVEVIDEISAAFTHGDGTFGGSTYARLWIDCSWQCGDCNRSTNVDIDDMMFIINYMFAGGPAPNPFEIGDVNCLDEIDIDDIMYLINYIFAGGPTPCEGC